MLKFLIIAGFVFALIMFAAFTTGCGAELTPQIHKAQQEEKQTKETEKQTILLQQQNAILERIATALERATR